MKCHQVLTGACNAGNRGFAVGSVEGISFSAYAAGSNVVILSVTFERVQIIPGALHNNVQISCLDTSTDTGKIAAAYGSHVCVYEPTPLVHQNSSHRLDYRWVETGRIMSSCFVATLSWNLEGTRLLTGGKVLQLWHFHVPNEEPAGQPIHKSGGVKRTVTFEVGDEDGEESSDEDVEGVSSPEFPDESRPAAASWRLLWENVPASPVTQAAFSPDGTLFATAATQDRLLRIWYEDKPLMFPSRHTDHSMASTPSLDMDAASHFSFVYIAHPQAVTGFSWRRTSKYMPKGSVCAMLVTSCRDNICRLWVETVLPAGPDDGLGLVSLPHWDPLTHANPKFRTQRHKTRILQRLKHVRHCFHLRRNLKHGNGRRTHHGQMGPASSPSAPAMPLPTFPSSFSVHESHGFGLHGTGAVLGLHFHLAAAVNAATDIPLVPCLGQGDFAGPPLVLHWLNNKEMHFTAQAEQILQELSKKALEREDWLHGDTERSSEATTPSNHETSPMKKKRVRGTTGDLAKFLRHQGHNSPSNGEMDSFPHAWNQPPSVGTVPVFSPLSGATSMASLATDGCASKPPMPLGDALDLRIETLLRDWHQSPDLLFAIHPLDGSFLVWLVDWLDEYQPGSFRQPQVSFSSRLPNALPLGDAGTMAPALALYNPTHYLDLRHLLHLDHHTAAATAPANYENLREEDEDQEDGIQSRSEGGEDEEAEKNEGNKNSKSRKHRPASLSLSPPKEGPHTSTNHYQTNHSNSFRPSPAPVVCLLTKHDNGSLNLWHLAFGEGSRFTQLLSVAHNARVSGHRFRVNDVTCHPVLPLLLTTSHHNVVQTIQDSGSSLPTPTPQNNGTRGRHMSMSVVANKGFCSELILWRVEPVGPLSRNGGVTELARINSPAASAFSSVAWIPTLLPAATLVPPGLGGKGVAAQSASACFVASDGTSLRVYQAVIDARSLLATIDRNSAANIHNMQADSDVTHHSEESSTSSFQDACQKAFTSQQERNSLARMVSEQSTSRPGCVLELAAIQDASHDWHNTQLLHVFQEQLMTGRRGTGLSAGPVDGETGEGANSTVGGGLGLMEASLGAVVDLQATPTFKEPFYVVVLEKGEESEGGGSIIHVWKLVIALQPQTGPIDEDDTPTTPRSAASPVSIVTSKVCTQRLSLPEGVEVVDASPAAGHLSSASIYPACFAPYVLVTACSDASVRFWKCGIVNSGLEGGEDVETLVWIEWDMQAGHSLVNVPGTPLSVSAAYSGRVAVAYKAGKSFTKPQSADPDTRYINLCVAIHECESSGGSEWVLEDTVHLKNIHLPKIRMDPDLDLSYLKDAAWFKRRAQGLQALSRNLSHDDVQSLGGMSTDGVMNSGGGDNLSSGSWDSSGSLGGGNTLSTPLPLPLPLPVPNMGHLVAVPSFSTLQTLRQSIQTVGNVCPLTQKFLVQLDWVSKEDGSHILTVGVGNKILLYTCVPESANVHALPVKAHAGIGGSSSHATSPRRGSLIPAASLSAALPPSVRWMRLRCLELRTADGLPPLPMHMSWVRDGIFVVGMDNEMHVYSQWKADSDVLLSPSATMGVAKPLEDWDEDRGLGESTLRSLAAESTPGRLPYATSMAHLPRASSMHALSAAASSGSASASRRPLGTTAEAYLGKKTEENAAANATTAWLLSECLPSFGLFEAAHLASPVLPQYHPRQLMELLHSGKAKWVKAILAHLVRCVLGQGAMGKKGTKLQLFEGEDEEEEGKKSGDDGEEASTARTWSRTRTLSISYPGGRDDVNALENGGGVVPEEVTLDYAEILAVPPLPLWTLLAADREESHAPSKQIQRYGQLFGGKLVNGYAEAGENDADEDDLDAILAGKASANKKSRISEDENGLAHFGLKHARVLTALLTHTQLPGLSSLDQMHLLAMADTVADIYSRRQEQSHHLDSCGVRFLLSVRHHLYLLRCLPPASRVALKRRGLAPAHLAWAFHSQSQEELLQILPQYAKGQPTWEEMREMGVGWWLRSNVLLRVAIERLAKCAFQKDNNPLDAAPYYLALGKKAVVWGLFRSLGDERMTVFFANNFSEDRWRKAALKNAYALLGKQRFTHAVAFFLLAGALGDAVEICLRRLKDLQLAMVIVRLYPTAGAHATPLPEMSIPEALRSLLEQEILSTPAMDPFLRSMAHWLLGNYSTALKTLLDDGTGFLGTSEEDDEKEKDKDEGGVTSPSVFNFYIFLRTHPLLVRQQRAAENKGPTLAGDAVTELTAVSPLERRLYFTTAHAHFLAGCPALALQVLSQLPPNVLDVEEAGGKGDFAPPVSQRTEKEDKGIGLKKESAVDFDWSTPVTSAGAKSDEFELKWSDDEEEDKDEDEDEDVGLQMKSTAGQSAQGKEKDQVVAATPRLDIMAQQLKFIACLKILMEELSTLATGFEVDGGQLRLQLYVWLEREVEALRELCHYGATATPTANTAVPDHHLTSLPGFSRAFEFEANEGEEGQAMPTLHQVLQMEKSQLEAKVQRMERRRRWLKANESLLRTLQSYCALHGSAGGGVASVRMELILLLQELSQERRPWLSRLGFCIQATPSTPSLTQPLPLPLSSVPLLAAAATPTRAMTTDPIRHLQSMVSDVLGTVTSLPCPPVPGHVSLPQICLLRDLGVALSACIYQSLCEADTAGQASPNTTAGGTESTSKAGQDQSHHAIDAWGALARLTVVYRDYHLIAASAPARKALQRQQSEELSPTTPPQKWPGVTSLVAMLSREREEDSPRLLILLVDAFVAVYTSLLAYALAACDAHILFRLASFAPDAQWWGRVFGGGAKQLLRVTATPAPTSAPPFDPDSKQRMRLHMKLLQSPPVQATPTSSSLSSSSVTSNPGDSLPSYREVFIPPKMSMVAALMSKPSLYGDLAHVDYDSSASSDEEAALEEEDEDLEEEEDDSDDGLSQRKTTPMPPNRQPHPAPNTQHSDPHSLAWGAIRLAVVRLGIQHLEAFFKVVGIEMNDLPVLSPLSHSAFRSLGQWEAALQHSLQRQGPSPPSFLPACHLLTESENVTGRPAPPLHKYRSILEPANTPFVRKAAARPLTRLWAYLVRQEPVQDVFVRLIFGKGKPRIHIEGPQDEGGSNRHQDYGYGDVEDETDLVNENGFTNRMFRDPVRIIHKDQEPIATFCLNASNPGVLALATPKEIQELDITPLLDTPTWMEDECELDLLALDKDMETGHSSGFLVVQTPGDKALLSSLQGGANGAGLAVGAASVGGASASSFSPQNVAAANAAGRNTTLPKGLMFHGSTHPAFVRLILRRSPVLITPLKRHRVDNVKRLNAHPHLPLYLSGASDGCVQVWEWGHTGPLATPRTSGAYAKVTRLKFNAQGNKFGVADADGNVSLWQLRLGSAPARPFLTQMCHSKGATDLAWLSCSSLIATAGHAQDGRNVALWDTLLPQRKALIHSWNCHEGGATCLLYAPQHQVLLSAGRRGDVCVWDVRQRSLRQRFAAVEGNVAIKCLALDPSEENLVTGSAEGDVRVWAWSHPTGPRVLHAFPADHARSSFFRSMAQGQGVSQVSLDASGRLISAGADGSIKLRHLSPRDVAVLTTASPYSSSWQG